MKRKFYVVGPEFGLGFHRLYDEMDRAPWWGGGFGDCPEPIFVTDRKLGPLNNILVHLQSIYNCAVYDTGTNVQCCPGRLQRCEQVR
jgi:hypothetical protein